MFPIETSIAKTEADNLVIKNVRKVLGKGVGEPS